MTPRSNVVDGQWNVSAVAVRAFPPPFLQQELADVVARQGAALILNAADVWGLQKLGVEPVVLKVDPGDREPGS